MRHCLFIDKMVDKLNMEKPSLIILFKKIKLERLLLSCRKDMYEEIYLSPPPPSILGNSIHTLENFLQKFYFAAPDNKDSIDLRA